MAGHNNNVAMDPALMKYNNMQVNRYKYFRWTPRTTWLGIVYIVLVPAAFGTMGYMTDGKYEFRGKRRGDTIAEF